MKICIKNPAPLGPSLKKWGDYHFGQSLQRALERRGATVSQHYWPDWNVGEGEDAILVLRGKRPFVPPTDRISMMWVISHPATVMPEEMDGYSVVFLASEKHRQLMLEATSTQIEVMRQCTDIEMFGASGGLGRDPDTRRGIVFVANSRGVRRDIVRWAIDSDMPMEVYGRHWNALGLGSRLVRDYIANEDLPGFYARSRLSLNDHWGDMAYFGIINNRIFDCLACGVPILSDAFPELRDLCGESILYADSPESFARALQSYTFHYDERIELTRRLWDRIGSSHTFDARAEQILAMAGVSSLPRGVVGKSMRPAENLRTPVDTATRALRMGGHYGEVRVFHVGPSKAWMQALLECDGIGYLSGGFGEGPWHVEIYGSLELVPDDSFDILVLDVLPKELLNAPSRLAVVLQAICRKVKAGCYVVLSSRIEGVEVILGVDTAMPADWNDSASKTYQLPLNLKGSFGIVGAMND